jgi:hypothetical protein
MRRACFPSFPDAEFHQAGQERVTIAAATKAAQPDPTNPSAVRP